MQNRERLPAEQPIRCASRVNGHFERTPERAPLENMDALPFVTPVYKRDLVIEKYNTPLTCSEKNASGSRGINVQGLVTPTAAETLSPPMISTCCRPLISR